MCKALNGVIALCVMHAKLNSGRVNPPAFNAVYTQTTRAYSFYLNGGTAE